MESILLGMPKQIGVLGNTRLQINLVHLFPLRIIHGLGTELIELLAHHKTTVLQVLSTILAASKYRDFSHFLRIL